MIQFKLHINYALDLVDKAIEAVDKAAEDTDNETVQYHLDEVTTALHRAEFKLNRATGTYDRDWRIVTHNSDSPPDKRFRFKLQTGAGEPDIFVSSVQILEDLWNLRGRQDCPLFWLPPIDDLKGYWSYVQFRP
jgi:hypothetical protein